MAQEKMARRSLFPKAEKRYYVIAIKYGFSLVTTLMAFFATGRRSLLLFGPLELAVIWAGCNALLNRWRVLGHVVHFLLLLLFNAQMLVMYFGNSFITLVMVTNLVSVRDLSGSFGSYLLLMVPLVAMLLLPMPPVPMPPRRRRLVLGCAAGAWLCAALVFGPMKSPLVNLGCLVKDGIDFHRLRSEAGGQVDPDAARFYRDGVADGRLRPEALPQRPNVVLLFVEGLSQSVVEDARGLMPNLAALEQRTLFFENYYNHTFATYRGLISQLYSGYQLSDHDANGLVSLQAILHDFGYRTAFINTEPNNAQFTEYLAAMGFDDFISRKDWVTQAYATLDYITDKDAFDRLYETIEAQHAAGQPFFTAMYTLGTHVSFDSPDLQFGDGGDPELNKFYNLDVRLGGFMERFEASGMAEDTLVIITADHATYADKAFLKSFPDTPRPHMEMDRVPLVVYYRGMAPETVDVGGRNSLDLAPTLLDYLDISAPNLFLGDSLFVPAGRDDGPLPLDRCFFDGSGVSKTGARPKEKLSKVEKQALMARIRAYLAVSIPAGQDIGAYDVKIEPSGDGAALQLSSRYAVEAGRRLWFAVWSMSEGMDNMVVYPAEMGDDGLWRCTVPLEAHKGKGVFYIHARVGDVDTPPEGSTVIMKIYYVD